MTENRTEKWVNRVKGLIYTELVDAIIRVLETKTESFGSSEPDILKIGRETAMERMGMAKDIHAFISSHTDNLVTAEDLDERSRTEIELLGTLNEIQSMAQGSQSEMKEAEKALFDDNGEMFRHVFRKAAGGTDE